MRPFRSAVFGLPLFDISCFFFVVISYHTGTLFHAVTCDSLLALMIIPNELAASLIIRSEPSDFLAISYFTAYYYLIIFCYLSRCQARHQA